MPSGLGPAALQEITPNEMRGQVTAIAFLVLNLVATTLGNTLVGLLDGLCLCRCKRGAIVRRYCCRFRYGSGLNHPSPWPARLRTYGRGKQVRRIGYPLIRSYIFLHNPAIRKLSSALSTIHPNFRVGIEIVRQSEEKSRAFCCYVFRSLSG